MFLLLGQRFRAGDLWNKVIVLFLVTTTVAGRGGGRGRGHFGGHSGGHYGSRASHSYPASSGLSGTSSHSAHSYPASTGLSGNRNSGQSSRPAVYHHYYYSPPRQVSYGSTYHPVYVGQPPLYVYEFRDSGSRYDNLLTGLALYNLGRNSHSHSSVVRQYNSSPGEICKLAISKQSGDYEETRIDCNLMSSFIWEDTSSTAQNGQHVVKNTTQVTVTQTVNGTGNSVSTVTKTSTTVEDALSLKGPSIAVTPGMTCSMIRTFRDTTKMRKQVDCGLLQEYARSSLQPGGAQCLTPLKNIILFFLILGRYRLLR